MLILGGDCLRRDGYGYDDDNDEADGGDDEFRRVAVELIVEEVFVAAPSAADIMTCLVCGGEAGMVEEKKS
jgi:hypothetical protein